MEKIKTLQSINRSYHGRMRNLTRAGRENDILTALSNGKNTYMRMDRLESSSYDSAWIDEIEGVIFDLGQIISNPKLTTRVEGNIVPVELARKINAASVQHLASHTQYVKEIDDYGNVIPSKILTMVNEDEIKTYENRFIATFVRRLVLFIEKRYEFISKFAELHDEQVLMFKNKSFVDGAEVEIETKIRINHKSDDEMSAKNNEYFERIKQMRQYILYFYNSSFMKQLKTEKDVHNPIIQTNIIRKNPLYHHCYEVYRFIERYESLGVNYKVDEQYSVLDEKDIAEINNTLFANYITLKGKDHSTLTKGSAKVYKPKIKTSPDDDAFIYGPLFAGPIEFLRVDEPYQNYLASKIRKDIPIHPTKREREYYADEYAAKAEYKEDLKQKNDLIKRKNKEIAAFNKAAAKIDQEREAARLALLEQERQIIKQEEDDMLNAARNEIIAASLLDQGVVQREAFQNEMDSYKVVEDSHPYEKPVTYDEAVLQLWPQIKNIRKPKKKAKVEEKPVVQQVPVNQLSEEKQPVHEPQPVVVPEYQHPYSEPVTYDEAALQIWPQIANAPALRVAPASEMPVEEAPVVVKKAPRKAVKKVVVQEPQPVVVPEYQHPYSEPVTYEQAELQIWPQIANAPALRVAPAEETEAIEEVQVVKQAPAAVKKAPRKVVKKTVIKEPTPAVVPEYQHPYSEPVTYEQAELQIWPQIANAPALRVPKEDPVSEKVQVKEEQPAVVKQVKKARKPATKKASEPAKPIIKEEPQPVNEQPVVEETPKKAPRKATRKPKVAPVVVEPIVEAPVEPVPAPVVAKKAPKAVKKAPTVAPAPVEEKPVAPAPKAVKKAPVVVKKAPAPKEPAPKKPAKPAPKQKEQLPKIPGKFIVKLMGGYYVNERKLSVYKEDAKIFDDFNLANAIKKNRGGKVIKL